MIPRKALLLLHLLFAFAASQNDQTEGSGGNLQNVVDQEGSGQVEMSDTEPSSSAYGKYLDTQFEPSIEEALLSSDSWMVENTNNDNDIIFMEEPGEGGEVGDDEDYVAEISGNNQLEETEEETNALAGLELDHTKTRTLDTTPSRGVQAGKEIEVLTVESENSGIHVEGNALGKTGDEEIVKNPVLSKYGGLSAILLLVAAVAIGASMSFIGFVVTKFRPCHKGLDVP